MSRLRRLRGVAMGAGALSLSPMLVSLATFLSLPIILRVLGNELWLSIAVGQVVAELARVVVIWGWNAIGLTVVAPMDEPQRLRYYFDSLAPRLMLLFPSLAAATLICYIVPTVSPLAAAVTGASGAVYGLSAAWVFIGARQPIHYLVVDSLPRALVTVVGAALLFAVPSAVVFSLLTLLGSIVAVVSAYTVLRLRAARLMVPTHLASRERVLQLLKQGAPAFGTGIILVARLSIPVLLTPVVAPSAGPAVALGDKFVRWTNTGMTPLIQALQVRISGTSVSLMTKVRRGLYAAWVTGPIIGAAVSVAAYFGSGPFSDGTIRLGADVAIAIGMVICFVFVAALIGNSLLVILERMPQVMIGAAVALIILLAAFVPLTKSFGAGGAFMAFATAESFVTLYQFRLLHRAIPRVQGRHRAPRPRRSLY